MASRPANRIAEEQAALRRVATLAAGGAAPEAVFAAVAAEVGRLLAGDYTVLLRYGRQDAVTIAGTWTCTGAAAPMPVGSRYPLGGRNVTTLVCRTGRPARTDYTEVSGVIGEAATHGWGFRSAVGVPIHVEGRLWGVMIVAFTREEFLPADTEARLAGFTELVATAIANTQARVELRGFAEEQGALRRVATLVASGTPPEALFAAVAEEAGRVLHVDYTSMIRFDPDGAMTWVGTWSNTGTPFPIPVGNRARPGGQNMPTLVFETGRPTRIDYADASGEIADLAHRVGVHSSVGVPISVAGRAWGLLAAVSTQVEPLAADTEARLTGFTELVATAIANTQARVELRGFAEEQAALRRVATLVARAAQPKEVFAAVTEEVGRLLGADVTFTNRYDPTGGITIVGAWTRARTAFPLPLGARAPVGGPNVHTRVYLTHRPARVDDIGEDVGPELMALLPAGMHSSVGVPIQVAGRLWGLIVVNSTREEPLPADTETRLAGFTELVGTAIANAEAQAALTASRARIVAAADSTRRRIERDLHDGAQQRLVSLALRLRSSMRAAVPPGADELTAQLDGVAAEIGEVLDELREIARGLHPAALADGGLRPALKTLARRCPVPVRLNVGTDGRLPEPIEIAAYYTVAETLTNAAKHARAGVVDVDVESGEGVLRVRVRDDGRGGADLTRGSGLVGLKDRVEALGGRLTLHSASGTGTTVEAALPLGGGALPAV